MAGFPEVQVMTIDAAQGLQASMTIVSCVRSNVIFEDESDDDRRVMATDSRERLGFLCDSRHKHLLP